MHKKKILVVDDEKDCCEFLREYLAKHGYDVDVAHNGSEAKNLLERNKYGYIFFDCNMPEMNGVELVKVIDEKNPEAKKIMISGYETINEEFARELGIDVFLSKPVSLKDIERTVKHG